jgi:hypothetical protein
MGMTHCRVCGVLEDVGEVVICEDCADKLSEHDAKIAEIAKIAKMNLIKRFEEIIVKCKQIDDNDQYYCWCEDLECMIESLRGNL